MKIKHVILDRDGTLIKYIPYLFKKEKVELNRFTTLINPLLLSNIKLVSYFTNKKLYEVINESLSLYIEDFEIKYNTKIDSIIQLQTNFSEKVEKESSK